MKQELRVVTPSGDDIDLFEFSHTAEQGSILKAGETLTFTVKVNYKIEATRLPNGETKFELSVNYGQGTSNPGSNTPGGGTDTPKLDNWDFEVDEDGTIVAYNYDLGTDVVIPATNYEGKAIKTITQLSFVPKGNIDLYVDESAMRIYAIVAEDNTTIVDTANNRTAAEVVVDKTLYLFTYEECQGETECLNQYIDFVYICTDKNACYQYTDETKTNVPFSDSIEPMGRVSINPDPNVSPEESLLELNLSIETLDLSKATNITEIGKYAFDNSGLESVDFGENSNITTIGDSAFRSNFISSLIIPSSVTTIGSYAFYYQRDYSRNGLLSSILIKIAEEDFLANVTVGENLYDNALNPTITYDPN